ncbi:MAG: XdhC family protein, partial [Proteobacteria bacterium]|nr:XdhC family protein [Pseudomonadota bacterium]
SCGSISVLVEVLAGDEPALDLALAELAAGRACSLVTALPPGSGRLCIDHDDNRAGDMQGSLGALTAAQLRDSSEVFFEELEPDEPLYIVGATDTAAQLCRMASATGFAVTVIDPRAAFARPDRFQDARALLCEWPQAVFKREDLPVTASVVTLSHDEKFDMPALEAALAADIRYVGALGSRATQARRRSELASRGVAEEQLDSIHGPVGLDLGGGEPAEIAVAVLAELVAARHGRALS